MRNTFRDMHTYAHAVQRTMQSRKCTCIHTNAGTLRAMEVMDRAVMSSIAGDHIDSTGGVVVALVVTCGVRAPPEQPVDAASNSSRRSPSTPSWTYRLPCWGTRMYGSAAFGDLTRPQPTITTAPLAERRL